MAKTLSKMNALGSIAPDFQLLDTVSGIERSLQELRGSTGTLIMFICNHCPFVKHIQPELVRLASDYLSRGISIVAISANDVENYPQDSPDNMKKEAQHWGYTFPYLYDHTQEVAKAYDAACTPDFFLFDEGLACVYRGQLDGSTPGNGVPLTGSSLRAAIDQLLAGESIDADQKPSVGCNIKWRTS